ncbi:hypothetical protein QBC44DRAFT_384064 [Cladorrhinum sp. PSN332]|nr:hypothetical protein QBC44DRAFT_384064 [Cladorrhinum sp. PSN332]
MGFVEKNGWKSAKDQRNEDIKDALWHLYTGLGKGTTAVKADLTIICGHREFKAHRAIFFGLCPYVGEELDPEDPTKLNLKGSQWNPDVFEYFLQYLYTGTYVMDFTIPSWFRGRLGDSDTEPRKAEDTQSDASYDDDDGGDDEEGEEGGKEKPGDGTPNDPGPDPDEPEEEYEEDEDEDDWSDDVSVSGYVNAGIMHHRLLLALRLYKMGNLLGDEGLQSLCIDRFYGAAEDIWQDLDCFPDLIDELYGCEMTRGEDGSPPMARASMHDAVEILVAEKIKDAATMKKMERVMIKHGAFAVGVMKRAFCVRGAM